MRVCLSWLFVVCVCERECVGCVREQESVVRVSESV